MATLPGAWRYRVSTGTGRPGVSILWLGEMESLICSFYLSVAARKIVCADPSLRYTRSHVAGTISNQQTKHLCLMIHVNSVWQLFGLPFILHGMAIVWPTIHLAWQKHKCWTLGAIFSTKLFHMSYSSRRYWPLDDRFYWTLHQLCLSSQPVILLCKNLTLNVTHKLLDQSSYLSYFQAPLTSTILISFSVTLTFTGGHKVSAK